MGCDNNKQDIVAESYTAPQQLEYKIMLVGDSGVGKTAIIE